jgi:prophage regulatory protein
MPADDTMLGINEVVRLTGVSKATINRHVQTGTFPKPFKISARRNGYLAREVKEWLERLDEQRHATRN